MDTQLPDKQFQHLDKILWLSPEYIQLPHKQFQLLNGIEWPSHEYTCPPRTWQNTFNDLLCLAVLGGTTWVSVAFLRSIDFRL